MEYFFAQKAFLGPLSLNHGIYIYQQPGPGLIFEVQNTILEAGHNSLKKATR